MNRHPRTFLSRSVRGRPAARRRYRASFTLLELLVSLGIILILATLTMRLLNATLNSDRIRNGAREFQSFLAGARDRALYAGQPRGVRLIQDPNDNSTVHSFVYVGAPSTFTDGTQITITTAGATSTISTPPASWTTLVNRGLLTDGASITLGGTTYSMARNGGIWTLTAPYSGASPTTYTMQLLPSPIPGEEPRTLPQNIVIDLDNSVLPPTWGSPGAITGSLDVLFSPNGTVTGTVAAAGRIHFVFSEYVDASIPLASPPGNTSGIPLLDSNSTWQANTTYYQPGAAQPTSWVVPNPQNDLVFQCTQGGQSSGAQPPQFFTATPGTPPFSDGTVMWQCYAPKPRIIVSLATSTGRVTTSPVNPLDKFRYAETGEVTQ
jgi:type II secretory pathway pseudopilin PulG